MPAANIIQLQALLSGKFPRLRLRLGEWAVHKNTFWPTGLPQIDESLQGGLPKGALTEITGEGPTCGSATLLRHLLLHAAQEKRLLALIDGNDSLDVTQIDENALGRLLWVRCHSAEEALKAADLILRDSNLPIVLLDLKANPPAQLRRVPATTWYRFQHLLENSAKVCAVFTPRQMVPPAKTRLILRPQFSLNALERDAADLERELEIEIFDGRQFREAQTN